MAERVKMRIMDTCILCDKEGSMAGKKLVYPQLSFIFTPRAFVCDVAKDAQDGKPHIAFESLRRPLWRLV